MKHGLSKERELVAERLPSNLHFAFPFGVGLLNFSRQARSCTVIGKGSYNASCKSRIVRNVGGTTDKNACSSLFFDRGFFIL